MLSFWIDFLETPNDLDDAVATRMERQRVIYQRGKRFAVVLEEQALRTWFGDAETQAGQLDRLLAVMSLPNVSVGIIPLMKERAAVASAGFWIFDNALVALETPTASIEVTRPARDRAVRPDVRAPQGCRRLRGSGPLADHQSAERIELAQQIATSWTARLCGSYDRRHE